MPHVFALVIAGAGIYAGFKWASRLIGDAKQAAQRAEAQHREAMARQGHTPKDLGTLDYDADTGVYRPRAK